STIRMIYGYSPLTSGELRVFGLDISIEWRRIRRRIGVCQQENTLDPDLTVEQNLEVFARYFDIPRHISRKRADELLRFIALEHRRKSEVTQLSGGMIRRMVLARALINQPDLLILDEPTTGLDPQSRHQIWERLDELKSKGLSILLTTHYMDEAARLCDRLLIMDHGLILVEGKPSALIREYAGEQVLEISSPPSILRDDLKNRQIPYDDLGNRLLVYGQRDDSLFKSISDQYCLEECIRRMGTLEDVFLRLTGRGLRE
ncbi:MAG TPA: ABC transporter ATP-binding protein, partial [Thermodesulfobacteriota bacterium]|nr:ABC transporter ATP-binding protein [Thermodesulfobacteriota bacterium]